MCHIAHAFSRDRVQRAQVTACRATACRCLASRAQVPVCTKKNFALRATSAVPLLLAPGPLHLRQQLGTQFQASPRRHFAHACAQGGGGRAPAARRPAGCFPAIAIGPGACARAMASAAGTGRQHAQHRQGLAGLCCVGRRHVQYRRGWYPVPHLRGVLEGTQAPPPTPLQAVLLCAPPKAPPGAGFPATAAGPRPTSSWLLMPAFRCIAGGGFYFVPCTC